VADGLPPEQVTAARAALAAVAAAVEAEAAQLRGHG